jgi:hypothetical protein
MVSTFSLFSNILKGFLLHDFNVRNVIKRRPASLPLASTAFWLGIRFDPEYRGSILPRNDGFSLKYTASQPRRPPRS